MYIHVAKANDYRQSRADSISVVEKQSKIRVEILIGFSYKKRNETGGQK